MVAPRVRGGCRRIGLFAALAVMAWLESFPALGEPVRVRAAAREDFGRIVFSWENPVSHESAVRGNRLTVRFGRPIEASYGRVTRSLRKYVRTAAPGDDGRSVVFTLKGDFDVYSFDSGSAVIVEIADKEPAKGTEEAAKKDTEAEAKPPPKAAAKAPPETAGAKKEPARKLPTVRLRSGQHPDYTRLVFDWPRKVPYQFNQDGGIVTVTFARAARIDLKAVRSRPPRFVGATRTRVGDDSVTVTFAVPPTSKVKHFLAGPKIVLDVGQPSGSKTVAKLPPPPPAVAETAAPPAGKPAPDKAAKPGGQTAEAAPASAAKAAPPTAAAAPGSVETGSASQTRKTAAAGAATPALGGRPGRPTQLTPKALTPPPLPPKPAQVTAKAKVGGPPAVTLRFDWDEPVGAAVFRRAGYLWVAFDKPTVIDVNQLRQAGGNIIKGIEQMGLPEATVLRMSTVSGINPSVRRDGLAWLLDFRKQELDPETSIPIKAQPESPVGARLFVSVPEPGTPIGVTDPEVGDNLVIVPVIPLAHGTALEYIYPQLRFLKTAQGIVVRPRADDIRVRPLRQGIEISSGSGLLISDVSAEAAAKTLLAAMKPLTRILDLDKWKITNIKAFTPKKYQLLDAISRAKGAKREAARLDLARFYFANGFSPEALSVLRNVARDRPEIEGDPEFRMLRGGSRFMMRRLAEAFEDFTHESLGDNDEAIFWRTAVQAASGDLAGAAKEMKRTGPIVRPYPKALKTPLGTLVTTVAAKAEDVKQARHFLEILRLDPLSPAERSRLDFEQGKVLELSGDFDGAVKKWEQVIAGSHRPSRVKATVARMELLLKLKRMTKAEALEELEKLRFAWRGDEFEFKLLRRLGSLYLDEGRYRKGLDRLRKAATHFRTHPDAPEVTLQMSDAFSKLYLDDGADALAPVTAIALYEEFKELTPAGEQGDEMIRKLADRLVGVDLLDRAAGLLNGQVRFRLKGVEKARVGTQLALVHVLARENDQALKVLAETAAAGMPEQLVSRRRHIRANVLMGLKRSEEAVAVLKGDKSRDAEMLRTEIYWRSRDWSNASQSLRKLIRKTGAKPGRSLDRTQAAHVLNYAIALTLSGNERALSRLRGDYGGAMAGTDLKDAFRLIVTPASLGLVDPASVASRVKEVENFQSFMAGYRERLKTQNLSEIVLPSAGPTSAGPAGANSPKAAPAPAAARPQA